jgi:Na+/H+-dicarboxylate symporter
MKKFPKLSITVQILLALLLACVVGYFLQDTPNVADLYIKPFGTIFLNLLKFIVVPLVMCSIISGIVSMKDISKVGRIGFGSMLYFMLTTIFAAALGLFVATLLKDYFPTIDLNVENTQTDIVTLSFMDQLVGFFPKNILEPILSSSMMQVIVIALFIGIAIVHVGEKAEAAKQLILSFNEIVTKILSYIMAISPIGVFCMLVPVVATNGAQVLGS